MSPPDVRGEKSSLTILWLLLVREMIQSSSSCATTAKGQNAFDVTIIVPLLLFDPCTHRRCCVVLCICVQLHHLLSLWRRATHARLAEKHAAATKIQSHVRRQQTMRRLPALQLAAHYRRNQLLQRCFARWMRRHRLLARWRRRWAAMLAAASGAARLVPGRSFTPFPARKWRSEEGTTAMADAYCEWRRRNRAWAVWTAFIVAHADAAAGGRAHEEAAGAAVHARRPGRR
jgi:hypothetical protein